jgi:hypothetical protein
MVEHALHPHHCRTCSIERALAVSALVIFAIFFAVFVIWLSFSKQNSKLYEADNVVCVSQPLSVQCFERKAR